MSLNAVYHKIGGCRPPEYGYYCCVQVIDNLAYIIDSYYGLRIINVQNSENPTILGEYEINYFPNSITINGNLAFITSGGFNTNIHIINISDPQKPTLVKELKTSGDPYQIAVSGDYAYVADSHSGVEILDISDPANAYIRRNISYNNINARSVFIDDSVLYIVDIAGGLMIYNVSNLDNITQIGFLSSQQNLSYIDIYDHYAYVTYNYISENGIKIIDISNPANPETVNEYYTLGYPRAVKVVNDIAYVAEADCGLGVINVSNPNQPELIGYYDTPESANFVTVVGSNVYIADGISGLQIIDVSNSEDLPFPLLISSCNIQGFAQSVAISNNTAYVADRQEGIKIIDISAPTNPELKGSVFNGFQFLNLTINGNYMFAACGFNGIKIIDISNSLSPSIIASFNTSSEAKSITIAGDYAYVANGNAGLQIINIQDPTNPTLISNYDTPDCALSVTVQGTLVFIADRNSGLQIIDITNPSQPQYINSFDTPGTAYSVVINNNIAYIADCWGLTIVDVFDLSDLRQLPTYTPHGSNNNYEVFLLKDNYLISSDKFWNEICIWDLSRMGKSNPPYLVTNYQWNLQTYGMAMKDDYLYTCNGYYGFHIFSINQLLAGYTPDEEDDDEELYVYLTSFFTTISNQNYINLNWISQVENNLIGYYVLKNRDIKLETAEVISPLISATNTSSTIAYLFTDTELNESGIYYYWLQYNSLDGTFGFYGPIEVYYNVNDTPSTHNFINTGLGDIYPNPFNQIVYIPYTLETKSEVKIEIYNSKGERVKSMDLANQDKGYHRIMWDGKDDKSLNCSNGIYILRMTTNNQVYIKKMLMLK